MDGKIRLSPLMKISNITILCKYLLSTLLSRYPREVSKTLLARTNSLETTPILTKSTLWTKIVMPKVFQETNYKQWSRWPWKMQESQLMFLTAISVNLLQQFPRLDPRKNHFSQVSLSWWFRSTIQTLLQIDTGVARNSHLQSLKRTFKCRTNIHR